MSPKNMEIHDVIVVGAGPAGSEIAYRMANAGFGVLVLEKDRLDREKPCGGGLQIQELVEFGTPPDAVIEQRIEKSRLISPAGECMEFSFSHRDKTSVTVRRSKYDRFLQERARKAGAIFSARTRVLRIRRLGGKVYVYTGHRKKALVARLLINAGGVHAAKLDGGRRGTKDGRNLAVIRHCWLKLERLPEALTGVVEFYYLKALSEGYAWIFPYRDVVSVGVGGTLSSLKKEGVKLGKVLNEFINHHPVAAGKLGKHSVVYQSGGCVPLAIPAVLHGTSTLKLGDAAGLANLIHCGGIYHARKSALIAADYCRLFLKTGKQDFLRQGGEAVKAFFTENEKRWDRKLKSVFTNQEIVDPLIQKGKTDKDIQKGILIIIDAGPTHKLAYDLLERKTIELIYSGLAEKAEFYKAIFDDKISRVFTREVSVHKYANQILMNKKAKRLRACLGILAAELFGGDLSDAVNFSLVYELFHTASLVHDDIMDKSSTRRGKPTLHKKYGLANAIIVGDLMLAKGYDLVAKFSRGGSISRARLLDLLEIIGQTGEKCCVGQTLDIEMATRHRYGSITTYLKMIEFKTGALIEGAVKGGAVVAGASRKDVELMGEFGRNLGIAFQIIDDAVDLLGGKKAGKSLMNDVKEGKATAMLIRALKKAGPEDAAWLRDLVGSNTITAKQATRVIDIYRKCGALEYAQRLGHLYIERARNTLYKLPEAPARGQFMEIVGILDFWCSLAR